MSHIAARHSSNYGDIAACTHRDQINIGAKHTGYGFTQCRGCAGFGLAICTCVWCVDLSSQN